VAKTDGTEARFNDAIGEVQHRHGDSAWHGPWTKHPDELHAKHKADKPRWPSGFKPSATLVKAYAEPKPKREGAVPPAPASRPVKASAKRAANDGARKRQAASRKASPVQVRKAG
jgi:hypothetical protein